MSDGGDVVLTAIGLFAGIGLFRSGFIARKRYKLIEGTPRSKVRSVAVGQVEVHGEAEPIDQPLTSPFAQAECVYFQYNIEERRKRGKNHSWVSIAKGNSEQPFYLRDETAAIIIDPAGADLNLMQDRSYRLGSFSSLAAEEAAFKAGLDRLGIKSGNFFGDRPLRCQESYISPKDSIFIFGTAKLREQSRASSNNEDNLTIGSSADNWFIISDHSESDVLSSLRWKLYLSIYGGPIMSVSCLIYLLYRFNLLF